MKHEINEELSVLGKKYQDGQLSLERYRSERRAVIDKLSSKKVERPPKSTSKLSIILIAAGLAFLAAYWVVFKLL